MLRRVFLRIAPDSAVPAIRLARKHLRHLEKTLRLKLRARTSRPLKIVVGSGDVPLPGWILTDIDQLDILVDRDWRRFFAPNSIHAIVAEHVWEHLTTQDGIAAARLCFRYLRAGGYLRIAVPDGLHPDPLYVDAVRPGGTGDGAKDHKVLYSVHTLQHLLTAAGFETRALEYFDEDGHFHATRWNPEDGMIHRSAHHDVRNTDEGLRYTSIIVDAFKPAHDAARCSSGRSVSCMEPGQSGPGRA